MTNRKEVKRAYQHLAAIKGFYWHFAAFASVLTGLLIINALTDGDWWVQWVFFGWGAGVLAHAFAVFARKPRSVSNWEERKIREQIKPRGGER
jgi:hypothetical protein